MEPEKLSAKIKTTGTSPTTTKEITAEGLLDQLNTLMARNKTVDEHRAKQLRKSWESFRHGTEGENPVIIELEKGFESLRERIHRQVEERNDRFSEIERNLEKLKSSLKSDDLKSAQQLENKVISGLNRVQGLSAQRRQKVIGELEALQPKIKKLSSWRHWGTVQAREQIIEEILNIHDTEKDLEKVANRIKQAREQWKQWDNSGEGGDKKLYLAFDNACTKAYEPCKALFEAQRQKRIASSRERLNICELLENEYEKTEWRNPDWRKLQQLVREQTSRWRKLGPAEYRDRKSLHRRFEQIAAKFDGPLDRERKRNLRQREELIDAVSKLADLEDSRKAISEIQILKKDWIVTVSGKRKQEQSIWKKFTTACDAVYEKSRQSKKAFDQQLTQNLHVKNLLCDEIESALEAKFEEADTLNTLVTKWKQHWAESGRAPKANSKQVDKRFRDTITKANQKVAILKQAHQSKNDRVLFDCASFCSEIERQVLENADLDLETVHQRWQQFDSIPDDLKADMQIRMDLALKAATETAFRGNLEQTLDKNFELVNGYLLQFEINTGVESPESYAKQRMALQIGRLSSAMGKATEQELLHNQELINRIHTTGAIPPSKQSEIDQRFTQCYQTLNYDDN
ncbi:MAG: DUF349 domain-containing protein [bacterium]